ncbi:hypothetical protein BOO94_24570 [Pseudomonas sp. FSL W5-0299]|nr:hypothetical protein BOO94_24570 [Pseudomonas sp. FSL W5-0299]
MVEAKRADAKQFLSQGYKQTDVGIIPIDWEEATISSVASIKVAKDVDFRHYSPQKDNKYRYPIYSNTVDDPGIYGYYDFPEYDADAVTVVGRGVGLGTAILRRMGFGAIGRLIVLFPKVDRKYLASYINARISIFNESSGVPQLTGVALGGYKIALPPGNEQTAIANSLIAIDALISSLESLIVKKQAIKIATMQQLLTGRTRLPQFATSPDGRPKGIKQTELGEIPEDWDVVLLGDHVLIKTGSRNNQDKVQDGLYPFYVRSETVERINSFSYECEAVLVPGEGGIGSIFHYVDGRFEAHQRVYVIREFKGCVGKYIYYAMLDGFGSHAMENSVKATVDSLRLPTFKNFKLCFPPVEEQSAIALLLSDLEGDLSVLEQRLSKTRQIKQGMMQELLTGRTRLV